MPAAPDILSGLITALIWFSIAFFGLALGSFATAVAYRVPRGISWVLDRKKTDTSAYRSICPRCKAVLGVADLIPVLSWFLSKGKCRHCNAPIGIVYPLTEVAVMLCVVLVFWVFGLSAQAVIAALCVPFLAALFIIDLERLILPNQLVWIVAVLGLVRLVMDVAVYQMMGPGHALVHYVGGALVYALMAWLLGYAMTKIMGKDALGFGDVKFFAVAGLWLGAGQLGWFCLLAGMLGVAFAFVWQKIKQNQIFPFGPALIVALYVLLLVNGSLLF